MSSRSVLSLLLVAVSCGGGPPPPDGTLQVPGDDERVQLDRLLDQVDDVVALVEASDELFERDAEVPLTPDEKRALLGIWAPLVDHVTVLDGLRRQYAASARGRAGNGQAFAVVYAAHAAVVTASLTFVARATPVEAMVDVLDEAQPEWGLSAGLYRRLRDRVLDSNAMDAIEKMQQDRLPQMFPGFTREPSAEDDAWTRLVRRAVEHGRQARRTLARRGLSLKVNVLLDDVEEALYAVVLPVQASVAEWMGDTRLIRARPGLVSAEQVAALQERMQPGDVIVVRRNWYVSNIGLPGFWPHSALYVGTKADLDAFDEDAAVRAAYPNGFSTTLAEEHPVAWAAYAPPAEDGTPHVVIEAVSEGIVFASADHALRGDDLGVLRPVRTPLQRARAIQRAFVHHEKPYDFDFDFVTDGLLVCSELVYKSWYPPSDEGAPLPIPLSSVLGRVTLPVNDIVRAFDTLADGASAELTFVGYYDGLESTGAAVEKDEAAFRASWTLPKWDWSQE